MVGSLHFSWGRGEKVVGVGKAIEYHLVVQKHRILDGGKGRRLPSRAAEFQIP